MDRFGVVFRASPVSIQQSLISCATILIVVYNLLQLLPCIVDCYFLRYEIHVDGI